MTWKSLQEAIAKNNSFIISSHVNQDGDCIGSQLSLYWYLESLGKKVYIYNVDKVPNKFKFLENSDKIMNVPPEEHYDVLFVLDSSNPTRTGWDSWKEAADNLIIIDHHRDNSKEGYVNIVDYSAAATSEILYNFFIETDIDFPSYVADTLYVGILTDTGGFQFSNTSSSILRACADLIDRGANYAKNYKQSYASYSRPGLMLRSKIWSTLEYHFNNKVAVMEMDTALVEEMGADYGDIEGMSDQALTASGVEVGLFIKYHEDGTHFSLRSSGSVDVGNVAKNIPGGGGHAFAAGCTVMAPYKEAKEKILSLVEKELV